MCLYRVCKVSDCSCESCGTSWFPLMCTIYVPSCIKWLSLISSHFAKIFFLTWHVFMHTLNISTVCIQSIKWLQWKLWTSWFLCACTIWALTKHLLRSKVLKKGLSLKRCHFVINKAATIHSPHDTIHYHDTCIMIWYKSWYAVQTWTNDYVTAWGLYGALHTSM